MGWKQWTRERLSSTELQQHLQDQVVINYPSASAFSAAVPNGSRKAGMLRFLQDVNRGEWFDSTAASNAGAWRHAFGSRPMAEFGPWDLTGTPSAAAAGVGMFPAATGGGLKVDPAPFSTGVNDQLSFPAGIWLVEWNTQIVGGAVNNGRAFHDLINASNSFRYQRMPVFTAGEDSSASHHLLFLTAATVIKFTGLYTTGALFTQRTTVRTFRLADLP